MIKTTNESIDLELAVLQLAKKVEEVAAAIETANQWLECMTDAIGVIADAQYRAHPRPRSTGLPVVRMEALGDE